MKKLLNVGKTILTSEIDQSTVDSKKVQPWLSRNRQIHCPELACLKDFEATMAHSRLTRLRCGSTASGLNGWTTRGATRHSRTRTLIEDSEKMTQNGEVHQYQVDKLKIEIHPTREAAASAAAQSAASSLTQLAKTDASLR